MITDILRSLPLDKTTVWAERISMMFPKEFKLQGGILIKSPIEEVFDYHVDNFYEETVLDYDYVSPNWGPQDYSLRRPQGLHDDGQWLELHPRLWSVVFQDVNMTYSLVHLEDNRYTDPQEHIDEVHFSWKKGMDIYMNDLEGKFDYQQGVALE